MFETDWRALYNAALIESDPYKRYGKIEVARRAIRERLDQLQDESNSREREQLDRALHALFTLNARRRSA
jgi:hypothetical protein